jgi:hypothetical protein
MGGHVDSGRPLAVLAALVLAALGWGCTSAEPSESQSRWTTQQAESIRVIRGLPVRVRHCRGLGPAREEGSRREYMRFRCLAGGRATVDRYSIDTVAVRYVLHPLAPYAGPGSSHRLTDVRFMGGPGIP